MGTSIQDPKNLAFEAIARREAHELQLQQKLKNNKRLHENNRVESSANLKALNHEVASSTSTANTPSKKDTEDHPVYLPLSHPVHEKLAMPDTEVNAINRILHQLLQSGDAAQNYMQGSKKMKIEDRVHLDNKVQERNISGVALARTLQSHSKRSKKHMSMKQHKKYGSLDVPQKLHNFETFKPMHEMWKGYILQLLNSVGKSQMAQCLVGADLHGAFILGSDPFHPVSNSTIKDNKEHHACYSHTVILTRCPWRVLCLFVEVAQCKMSAFTGVSGIMIRETAETFGIITKDNKFKVVLKKISVFMVQVDCWKITLYGDKLTSRKVGL